MSNDADTIRAMIEHENLLTNQRMDWSLKIQGFLFAALTFAWDKCPIIGVLCLLGIGISLLTAVNVCFSTSAVMHLLEWWMKEKRRLHKNKTPYSGPPVVGASFEKFSDLSYFSPSVLISFLFSIAWIVVAFVKFG